MASSKVLTVALFFCIFIVGVGGILRGERIRTWYMRKWIPGFVHFGTKPGHRYTSLCGGVLVSWNYVLTAAHCEISPEKYVVFLGTNKLHNLDAPYVLDIERVSTYGGSISTSGDMDLALVRLRNSPGRRMRQYGIKPMRIFWRARFYDEESVMVAIGFGPSSVYRDAPLSEYARMAQFKKIDSFRCIMRYFHLLDPDRILCLDGGRQNSTCEGDSGGPIIAFRYSSSGTFRAYIVGIAVATERRTHPCGEGAKVLAVAVDYYRDWITRHIYNEIYL